MPEVIYGPGTCRMLDPETGEVQWEAAVERMMVNVTSFAEEAAEKIAVFGQAVERVGFSLSNIDQSVLDILTGVEPYRTWRRTRRAVALQRRRRRRRHS